MVARSAVEKMRDTMATRGPDDAGVWLHHNGSVSVGLGHRRLSIIDLSPLGHQPMSTSDETLWIVFNGEIFNYRELRDVLLRTGRYSFRSQTDTEVILYAVREWGLEGCLTRLRGMYAFSLYDTTDNSLTLVRDPLGVKPLYYIHQNNFVAFASEIKAILAVPGVKKQLNDTALYHYLTFSNTPAPFTLFDGILKLEAGTYLRIDRNLRATQTRYWNPAEFLSDSDECSEHEYIVELRRLLRQSVARRMVSDVPFGVFLSGGVDSSLNVALMAEQMDRPVETFSIGIKNDNLNEFHYAQRVAKHFGTNHHEVLIDQDDFLSFLPNMPFFQDEPLADPVCVPIYYLSKLARESGVPVIQVGEGSDEIFAGYAAYHLFTGWRNAAYKKYTAQPRWLQSLTSRILGRHLSPEYKDALRRSAEGSPFFMGNAVAFWDCEKPALLAHAADDTSSSRWISRISSALPPMDPLRRIINIELTNRLPELLLMRVDKMSMANSIETRVPFLDEDIVEFGLKMPSHLKYRNGQAKYVLKKAAEGILPDEIIYRKKIGFCGSATNMLTEKLATFAYDTIAQCPLMMQRFNMAYIDKLFDNYKSQRRFNSFKIWNLLNLALWYNCWFDGS